MIELVIAIVTALGAVAAAWVTSMRPIVERVEVLEDRMDRLREL